MVTLYDARGNPVDLGKLKDEVSGPVITGVRPVLSGHPAVGLTPLRLGALLKEAEMGDPMAYMELAEDMEERDAHYRSVLSTRKFQVAGLDVVVDAATDSSQDVKMADFIRDWLRRDQLTMDLFDILDATGKGYSATEIIWEASGNQWIPGRLETRDPRWFWLNVIDRTTLMLRTEEGPQPLDAFKYIVHTHKSKTGLPIRGGLARVVSWNYLFKNFDLKGWVQLAEIFGQPLRVGKYGAGATENDKKTLLKAVANITQDTACIIPASMQVEFVEASLTGNITLHENLANFLDRQVSKAVLGQTGTTDTGQHVGTADAHEQVRQDIETADAIQLAATLNRDLVKPMVDLNFGPQQVYPRIRIIRPDSEDMEKTSKILATLVPLGLQVEEAAIRAKLGLPDPAPDAVLLKASAPPPPNAEPGHIPPETLGKGMEPHSASLGARISVNATSTPATPGSATPPEFVPDSIDLAVSEELGDWQGMVNPMLAPVKRLLSECDSFDEFMKRLPEVIPAQDASKMVDHLAKMMFAARLAGEAGAPLADGKA
jgi:phage gp29-like protein